MVQFDYDSKGDALEIFKEGEKINYSVELFEDYFINIGSKGRVVGLDILKATEALDLTKKELGAIKNAELYTSETKIGRKVVFVLHVNKAEIKSQIMVPPMGVHDQLKW